MGLGGDKSSYDVTLREYLEARLEATEDALALARVELERRLASMNEFRDQLREQAAHFVTREALEAQIRVLEARMELATKGKVSWSVATIVIILTGLVVALATALLTSG